MDLIFDIETDGLNAKTIWCIAAQIDGQPWMKEFWGPDEVQNFPQWLKDNDVKTLIGHNIINFDIPVIERLLNFKWWGGIKDTLVMSKLDNPSRKGGHSLKAWGEKLEFPKDEFSDFAQYSEEMKHYCIQDVAVNGKVYSLLKSQNLTPDALNLEQQVAKTIHQQSLNGWKFKTTKAVSLMVELKQEMFNAEDTVRQVFKPLPKFKKLAFPKVPYKKDGSISSAFQNQLDSKAFLDPEEGWGKYIYPEFNLGSRKQIGEQLIHFGWTPTEFTEHGQPIVSETILEKLEFPEGKIIANYIMLQKRLAMVSSWVDNVDVMNRIHGHVNSCGAVTGRMTHSKPNLAQVPASYSPYGKECRELFTVEPGYKLVGMDASGLELRMLAHYMNDEQYIKEATEGDIHTANQEAAGLETRDQAKTFIYAFLYGAGDEKIGSIVGGSASDGKKLKKTFLDNTPPLKELRKKVTTEAESGKIVGLDGRKLHIRSTHAALNVLLQSAGAIVMKRALLLLKEYADAKGLDYKFVGNIHDEVQTEVREDQAELFGELAVQAIRDAGLYYEMNCPLDGEYKLGNTWKETH